MTISVAHLTSVHSRADNRIFYKECCSLFKSGYSVSLIVADGKGDEVKDGVSIYDIGSPNNRFQRIIKKTNELYKKAKLVDADIYHFHDPELIPIGAKLKKDGKIVIYDIHEDVPTQLLHKHYISKPLRKILSNLFKAYQKITLPKFDALLVPQPTMVAGYNKLASTILIENFAILTEQEKNDLNFSPIRIFHAGSITEDRGLFNMLAVAEKLQDKDTFYLAGTIDDVLLEQAKRHPGWSKICYLGQISKQEVIAQYQKANVGVILYNNVDQYHLSYAVKLFEYMAYGIPVIMPDFGEWVSFNNENHCGVNVNVNSAEQIISGISTFKNGQGKVLGENGFNAVTNIYNWNEVEKKLCKLYRELSHA